MQVKIGISNRHIHLTEEDYKILFNKEDLEKTKDLVQTGEFASTDKVTIRTPKSEISGVRVLGPFRAYSQVEISRTDSYVLGINPPVRDSGDIDDSAEVTIVGPDGEVTKKCCILATRHIHINKEDRQKYGLTDKKYVSVKIGSEKSSILENVSIKETKLGVFELHLDTDDANACLLKNGDMATIII